MKSSPNELVPLTADEKDLLLTVYDKRIRLLFFVYVLLFTIAFGYSFKVDIRGMYSNKVTRWEESEDAKYLSRLGMITINFCFLETMVVGTGLYFFFKRVWPLKKDANSGMKEKVPYKIIKKEYYAISDQYFFDIDDYVNLHHEVDADTYNTLNEGDYFYIYRGAKSKFIFEENGRYTIL